MNEARSVADRPAVVVWAESVTAALVMGLPTPAPRRAVLEAWPTDSRHSACSLATLTDRAVGARAGLLRPWVDLDEFAAHLVTVLATGLRVADAGPVSPTSPMRWQAGYFRYVREWFALSDAVDADPAAADGPTHPETDAWARRGLHLEGSTLGEQLEEIRDHPSFAPGTKRVAVGDPRTSGLLAAVIALGGDSTKSAVRRAVRFACTGRGTDAVAAGLGELLEALV